MFPCALLPGKRYYLHFIGIDGQMCSMKSQLDGSQGRLWHW
jgi:hypothetical protein